MSTCRVCTHHDHKSYLFWVGCRFQCGRMSTNFSTVCNQALFSSLSELPFSGKPRGHVGVEWVSHSPLTNYFKLYIDIYKQADSSSLPAASWGMLTHEPANGKIYQGKIQRFHHHDLNFLTSFWQMCQKKQMMIVNYTIINKACITTLGRELIYAL